MKIVLLFPLFVLIRSDFRERQIRLYVLLVFAGLQLAVWGGLNGMPGLFSSIAQNGLLLFCCYLSLLFYYSLRCRQWIPSLRGYIGKGDLLFLLCLTPGFQWRQFLYFLILSFVAALVYWLFSSLSCRERGVPLVSVLGICYVSFLLTDVL